YLRMKTSTHLVPLSKAHQVVSAPGSVRLATVAQDQETPTTIACGMTATHTSKNDRFDDAARLPAAPELLRYDAVRT
ncbi:hypothetical protein DYB35_006518, partial [Aphanomyces astaci]